MSPGQDTELGKTTLLAWLIVALLVADGEPRCEVYSVANSTKQAKKILEEIGRVIKASPELSSILEVIPSAGRVIFSATNSYFEVLPSRPSSVEGVDGHAVIFDELHKQRDSELWAALEWAGSARRQPLCPVSISTAGVLDPTAISWQVYQRAKAIISGALENTDTLAIVYEIEPEDEWRTTLADGSPNPKAEAVWRKANPSLGYTIDLDKFRREVEKAEKDTPSAQADFARYRFGVWCGSSDPWISDTDWMACAGEPLKPEIASTLEWYGGLDLSSTTDVTALVLTTKYEGTTYVVPFFWVSEEQAKLRSHRDKVNYLNWVKSGDIRETEGAGIDYSKIRKDIVEDIGQKFPIVKLGMDRWNATQLAQQLADDGLNVVWRGQGYKDMDPPTKEIERLIVAKELCHGGPGSPVLRWMVGNVMIQRDDAGNIKVSKKRSREKVDGVVALCMSIGASMIAEAAPSMYESEGVFVV